MKPLAIFLSVLGSLFALPRAGAQCLEGGLAWADGFHGSGLNAEVRAFTVWDDGGGPALYASGVFAYAGEVNVNRIARLNGNDWTPLGVGLGVYFANALAVFDAGNGSALYVGGDFNNAGGPISYKVARWNGSAWSSVPGLAPAGRVNALIVHDDGSGPALYAGGFSLLANGQNIARWDGSGWSTLGTGVNHEVRALALFDDGLGGGPALYATGMFSTAGGAAALRIARWDGQSWSPLGEGLSGTGLTLAVHDEGDGPALYVGGSFQSAGGTPSTARLARWNGQAWSSVGGSFDDDVRALAVFDDGSGQGTALYAAGTFDVIATAGGPIAAESIARWNGSSWSPLGAGITAPDFPLVNALCAFDASGDGPDLYAGGLFQFSGDVPAQNVARWDGCAPGGLIGEPHCFGDGSLSTACPCGNFGGAGRGCASSQNGQGARLSASGTTTPDALVLTATGVLPTALSVFFQGDVDAAGGIVFGDGLRCADGNLKRMATGNASQGTVAYPEPGDLSISAQSSALGDPLFVGAVRHYQTYYRDPDPSFCPTPVGNTWNATNAMRIVW